MRESFATSVSARARVETEIIACEYSKQQKFVNEQNLVLWQKLKGASFELIHKFLFQYSCVNVAVKRGVSLA